MDFRNRRTRRDTGVTIEVAVLDYGERVEYSAHVLRDEGVVEEVTGIVIDCPDDSFL
jgi:hypothetical protein